MSVADQSSAPDQDFRVPKISVPHIGALLGGRYRITCRLAEGTFGHTYLAKDTHFPHSPECVIKQLKPQMNERAMGMARRLFYKEAETLAELGTHDQIPRLLAHFEQNNEFFLAQEFIDGYPISDELTPDRPWPDTHVVRLLTEILEVLTFVHSRGVIHRDIKPGNLIRRRHDGKVVLIDFGAVKQATHQFLSPKPGETDYTVAIGTFGYIPKEQLGGRPRFSSDVFAVGMIGIQALTGIHPNDLMEDERTAELRWRDRLIASIHPGFADIIDCMVRYDFRDRYPNAESALRAIQSLPQSFREAVPVPPWRITSDLRSSLPPTAAFDSQLINPNKPSPAQHFSQPSGSLPSSSAASTYASGYGVSYPTAPTILDASSPVTPSIRNTAGDGMTQIDPTQMTDVVAPSFSRHQPESMPGETQNNSPLNSGMETGLEFSSGYGGGRSLLPDAPLTHAAFKHWKDEVLTATGWVQHWLTRSWRIVALIGGTSLTLMLVRGLVASTGSPPPEQLQPNVIYTTVLEDAEYLKKQIDSIDEMVSPRVEALKLLDQAYYAHASGRYQNAIELYQQALGLDPRLTDALWGKCAVLNAQGQFEIASSVCYKVLAIDPNHAKALWSSAEANDKMGLHQQAAAERRRALELDPNLPTSFFDRIAPHQARDEN